jgi:hypothetical protein
MQCRRCRADRHGRPTGRQLPHFSGLGIRFTDIRRLARRDVDNYRSAGGARRGDRRGTPPSAAPIGWRSRIRRWIPNSSRPEKPRRTHASFAARRAAFPSCRDWSGAQPVDSCLRTYPCPTRSSGRSTVSGIFFGHEYRNYVEEEPDLKLNFSRRLADLAGDSGRPEGPGDF